MQEKTLVTVSRNGAYIFIHVLEADGYENEMRLNLYEAEDLQGAIEDSLEAIRAESQYPATPCEVLVYTEEEHVLDGMEWTCRL